MQTAAGNVGDNPPPDWTVETSRNQWRPVGGTEWEYAISYESRSNELKAVFTDDRCLYESFPTWCFSRLCSMFRCFILSFSGSTGSKVLQNRSDGDFGSEPMGHLLITPHHACTLWKHVPVSPRHWSSSSLKGKLRLSPPYMVGFQVNPDLQGRWLRFCCSARPGPGSDGSA